MYCDCLKPTLWPPHKLHHWNVIKTPTWKYQTLNTVVHLAPKFWFEKHYYQWSRECTVYGIRIAYNSKYKNKLMKKFYMSIKDCQRQYTTNYLCMFTQLYWQRTQNCTGCGAIPILHWCQVHWHWIRKGNFTTWTTPTKIHLRLLLIHLFDMIVIVHVCLFWFCNYKQLCMSVKLRDRSC